MPEEHLKKDYLSKKQFCVLGTLSSIQAYTIWPAFEPYPMIYRYVFGPATQQECQAWIEKNPSQGFADIREPVNTILQALSNAREAGTALLTVLEDHSRDLDGAVFYRAEARLLVAQLECTAEIVSGLSREPMPDTLSREEKWSAKLDHKGEKMMKAGAAIAAAAAILTPGIPDGEVIGTAMVAYGGAACFAGYMLEKFDM